MHKTEFNFIRSFLLCTTFLLCVRPMLAHDGHQENFLEELIGFWEYDSNGYKIQVEFFKESNVIKAYYNIVANNGNQLDSGSRDEINISIRSVSANDVKCVLISSYSEARFNAVFTKASSETIKLSTESAIVDDMNFYPRKDLLLRKQ